MDTRKVSKTKEGCHHSETGETVGLLGVAVGSLAPFSPRFDNQMPLCIKKTGVFKPKNRFYQGAYPSKIR
jgi:hypothetical protein